MENRIFKALEIFKEKYSIKHTNEAAFYMSDFDQIMKASDAVDKGKFNTDKLYTIVFNALKAGFIIGYRKAERDRRKKA